MCHRFNLTTSQEMVATFLKSFSVTVPPALLPSKDYYPICEVLTLRMIGENEWTIEPRSWGFLPRNWKPSDKVRTRKSFQRGKINARSETVDQTWPWKLAFPAQRCVLLASCFYEPSRNGGDNRYRLLGHDVFCIAGLWDHYEGNNGKGERESVNNCVMLTTDANALVASTRKGRMRQPVLLTEATEIERYCSLELTEHDRIANLFTPWPDDQMQCAADSP